MMFKWFLQLADPGFLNCKTLVAFHKFDLLKKTVLTFWHLATLLAGTVWIHFTN